jgi:hypothetical protein
MSHFHATERTGAATLMDGAARAMGFLAGGAAILVMAALWLAVLWCCRLFSSRGA